MLTHLTARNGRHLITWPVTILAATLLLRAVLSGETPEFRLAQIGATASSPTLILSDTSHGATKNLLVDVLEGTLPSPIGTPTRLPAPQRPSDSTAGPPMETGAKTVLNPQGQVAQVSFYREIEANFEEFNDEVQREIRGQWLPVNRPVEQSVADNGISLNWDDAVGELEDDSILAEDVVIAELEPAEPLVHEAVDDETRPRVLREPLDSVLAVPEEVAPPEQEGMISWSAGAPLGFTGPSGVLPRDVQSDSHFVPAEDRWRSAFPDWDRYDRGFPLGEDYPFKKGRWWDPYNQNVLKGDYPVVGQNTFLNVTVKSITFLEGRQVPTATTPFESTVNPFQAEFFGNPTQMFFNQPVFLSIDLFHGNAGFKPLDWQLRVTPVFNTNQLDVNELGVILPDVRTGTVRSRDNWALEEWFVETKLADLGPEYDFLSARAGSQFFVSDFRGFIFFDVNRAVRLFGTRLSNRDQFNVIWFDQTEKETNSQLNSYDDRHQNTLILNYYRQDFIWPGYTAQMNFHYNRDEASFRFDRNNFLVRPDPVGVFQPHEINAYYIGWTGDGHINRINVSNACYVALGEDELNPIAGKPQDIQAMMLALELSIDRDWARFRTSFFWSSGDQDPTDGEAEGFDAIFPNPNFAGGMFSYWQRQAIQLFGVQLVNDRSLAPSLRSSRIQGQTNFVNPGLLLYNIGMDMDVTPKLKLISNVNFLWFDKLEPLKVFTFQEDIHSKIGTDLSLGVEYRPLLNDNLELIGGIAGLIPGRGFENLYDPLRGDVDGLFAGFIEMVATY